MEFLRLYFKYLSYYDYIGFGVIGVLFLLLFILSLMLLFKRPLLGSILTILSFLVLPFGIYGVKILLDKSIRKSAIQIIKLKPLHYSKSLLIEAKIKNLSRIDFKTCLVRLEIVKKSNSKLKNFLYRLKPLKIKSIYLNKTIKRGSVYTLKEILDNIVYLEDSNMTAKINCY